MSEETLPPLPWRANESKTRILDADGEQIAQITCPHWAAVADLLLRAPQVEQAARPERLDALERLIRIARLALSWGMAGKDDCPDEFGADVDLAASLLCDLRVALGEQK